MNPEEPNRLDEYTTAQLIEELQRRGQTLASNGRLQAGRTLVNRCTYLLDHMPGAVLRARPADLPQRG